MEIKKQNRFLYGLMRIASFFVAKLIFKRKFIRNELKGKKGPLVVIANHQAALDFVNLIGATGRPMTFVISESFYSTLPFKRIAPRLGLIPKQQFQTSLHDIKAMKKAVEDGKILVIYPAGLMCEDGLSTPIPAATYQFLKWIKADVYMARSYGTYFSMPKWTRGLRAGRTYLDVYKLFSKEELQDAELSVVKEKTDGALLFDAYREQEEFRLKRRKNSDIRGLENVLYKCPHCGGEFTVRVKDKSIIFCEKCGFGERSDKYAFLTRISEVGEEIRYVSDWSRMIYDGVKRDIEEGRLTTLSTHTVIKTVDKKKNEFVTVGEGELTLTREHFTIDATIDGVSELLVIPIAHFASLPFSPGKHIELQHGEKIYRCCLSEGRLAMKIINMVKAFHEMSPEATRVK